jgi:hypothetical protein
MASGIRHELLIITLFVLIVALVCSCACIQPTNTSPGPGSGPSYTPKNTPPPSGQGSGSRETETVNPENAQNVENLTQAGNKTVINTSTVAKYLAGSSVQKLPSDSSYDKDHGWVIVKVNDDGTYTVGQIYFDPEVKVWFKVSEESLVTRAVHAVERDYPVLKGSVNWNSFPTKHGVVDQYGTTRLEW